MSSNSCCDQDNAEDEEDEEDDDDKDEEDEEGGRSGQPMSGAVLRTMAEERWR